MNISILICTYNRADSLRQTLQTCCTLIIPVGITWELIVVDNNSADHTKQVCDSFTSQLPLRYIFECHQGLSYARNRALDEAQGDLLLFTDDDVDLSSDWIEQAVTAAKRHPGITFFGGKVISRWDAPPPHWIMENLHIGLLSHLDRGDEEKTIWGDKYCVIGANMIIRRNAFTDDLRFNTLVGPTGSDTTIGGNLRGEESDVLDKLLARGHKGMYAPSIVGYHRQTAHRLTEKYVRNFSIGYGIADVRLGITTQKHKWFGVPRYYWKTLLINSAIYVLTRWLGPSRVWLKAEMQMAQAWGSITEFLRQQHPGWKR